MFKRLDKSIDPVLFALLDKDFNYLLKFRQIRNQLKITNDLLDKYKDITNPKKKDVDDAE